MADHDELRLRHLADIHATIARMSQNSFAIRGWAVTLVSFVFAIISTRTQGSRWLVLIAVPAAVIFWLLDGYYLRQERLFRRLYAAVGAGLTQASREGTEQATGIEPFDMSVDAFTRDTPGLLATLFTWHVVAIPAILTALIPVCVLLGA